MSPSLIRIMLQLKKAYVDSGLQLQQSRLVNAKLEEAKQKDEYDQSMKVRKGIEDQIAALTKETAGGSASSKAGASASATTATTTTTSAPKKPPTTTAAPSDE